MFDFARLVEGLTELETRYKASARWEYDSLTSARLEAQINVVSDLRALLVEVTKEDVTTSSSEQNAALERARLEGAASAYEAVLLLDWNRSKADLQFMVRGRMQRSNEACAKLPSCDEKKEVT